MSRLVHPGERRLKKRPEFLACYNQGRRYFSKRFVVFVSRRPDPGAPSRLGAGVGRKTGNAVKRNRVKRLIREFFRQNQGSIGPGLDLAVVPKRGIDVAALHLDDVTRELLPVLEKALAEVATATAPELSGTNRCK